MLKQKTEYSRYYGDFRGVDFSSDHTLVSERRFPYLVNMYKDYAAGAGQGIETIPGFRRRFVAPTVTGEDGKPKSNKIHGIHSFKDKSGKRRVYVHAGDRLYDWASFPLETGFSKEVKAVAKDYDEYSSSIEGVGIETDYIKIEVAATTNMAASGGEVFIDIRAIRAVGSEKWISIYTEAVYYGENIDAIRLPKAYTFSQKKDDAGKLVSAIIKMPKVVKDASGAVVATFAAGDSIEIQKTELDLRYPGSYRTRNNLWQSLDTSKKTPDGKRIVYYEWGDGRETPALATPVEYKINGNDDYSLTFISEGALLGVVELDDAIRIADIVASDGTVYKPMEPQRGLNAVWYVYFIVDDNGKAYQLTEDGEKISISRDEFGNTDFRVRFLDHDWVRGVTCTALEYDEYTEGDNHYTDYVKITDENTAKNIELKSITKKGGTEISDYTRYDDGTILVKKEYLEEGAEVTLEYGSIEYVPIHEAMNEHESRSFVFNNRLYILDGKNYLYIDVTPEEKIEVETEEGTEIKVNPEKTVVKRVADEAYIPTTYINIVVGGENADAGTEYETRNMLSPYFKHTFVPVDSVTEYCMNERDLDGIKEVKVYGKVMKEGEDADYTVDLTDGKVIFNTPPALIKAGFEAVPGTPGLEYTLTDAGTYICGGRGSAVDTEIEIGNYYNGARVTEVKADAFARDSTITSVKISEGIVSIGDRAFYINYSVKTLSSVVLPNSLEYIGKHAFQKSIIESVTIPKGVATVEYRAFAASSELSKVTFKGKPEKISLGAFEECENLTSISVPWKKREVPGAPWGAPNMTEDSVTYEVTPDEVGETEGFGYPELYAGVEITAIKAPGKAEDVVVKNNDGTTTTMKKCPYMYDNAIQMIESATLCTVFDDRVFFSGIPRCPRLILWCGRNLTGYVDPSYIGILNYVEDGVGNSPVTAMLPLANTLLVLKGDTEFDGAVYYHTPHETGVDVMPKTYPSEHGLSGIGCLGAACNFLDDPVFISRLGLEAIGQLSVRYERAREHRSSLIDAKLVNLEGLRDAKMCEWNGYLVLLVDGRIFLADSRQVYQNDRGEVEYEWYYLEDIGVFEGQYKREKYIAEWPELFRDENGERLRLTVSHEGKEYTVQLVSDVFPDYPPKEVAAGLPVVVGEVEVNGKTYYYDAAIYSVGGTPAYAFLCDGNGEMIGGEFSPAVTVKSIEEECKAKSAKGRVVENLFFGTENGVVCSFNFDMREADGTILAEHYTFDERAIYSGCALKMDNCGIPHMTKTTVKKSTVIKVKSFQSTAAKVRVRTNVNPYNEIARINATRFSFENLDFSDFSFVCGEDSLFSVKEKEKKWVEKQYFIYSDEYQKPFALFYAAFKYFVAGKFKK